MPVAPGIDVSDVSDVSRFQLIENDVLRFFTNRNLFLTAGVFYFFFAG